MKTSNDFNDRLLEKCKQAAARNTLKEAAARNTLADHVMEVAGQHLSYLADRWADESEYENWDEYIESMRRRVNGIDGATFLSMHKRPFAFRWMSGIDAGTRETRIKGKHIETERLFLSAKKNTRRAS